MFGGDRRRGGTGQRDRTGYSSGILMPRREFSRRARPRPRHGFSKRLGRPGIIVGEKPFRREKLYGGDPDFPPNPVEVVEDGKHHATLDEFALENGNIEAARFRPVMYGHRRRKPGGLTDVHPGRF